MSVMETCTSLRFSAVAKALGDEARRRGLQPPAFRSPPRLDGARRTIRRAEDSTVIAVRLRGRTAGEVAADMVEGVVVANRLSGADAARCRAELEEVVAPLVTHAA